MRAAPALFSLALLLSATSADAKVMMAAPRPEPVACTMEAKLCPDGSSVSRQGPNCEFAACPDGNPPPHRQHVAPMPVNPQKKPPVTTPDDNKDDAPDATEGSEGSDGSSGDEGSSGGDPDDAGTEGSGE